MRRIVVFMLCIGFVCMSGYASAFRIVAKVDGTAITEEDIQSFIRSNTFFGQQPPSRKIAAENLLAEALMYKEAKEKGLDEKPGVKEQIEREVRRLLANVYIDEAVRPQIKVAEEEIETYYANNKEKFTDPKLVSFNMVRITKKDKKGQEVGREVAGCVIDAWKKEPGKMVSKVAGECQSNPDLIIEGLAPELAKKGLWPEKIDRALFSMQAGEVSEIIEDDAHYMVIKVVYVRPETLQELKVVSDAIRKTLEQEKFIQLRKDLLQALSKKYKIELYEEFK